MPTAQLLISDSEHHADMLYVSRIFIPDAFIVIGIEHEGATQWHGLLSPLEVDRAKKDSALDEVHLDTLWRDKAKEYQREPSLALTAAAFLHAQHITRITVPGHFPLMYADILRELGFEVQASSGTLFPQRAIKTEAEIQHLARAEQLTRASMVQAENFLAACSINNDQTLTHPTSKQVTSADVRAAIETFLIAQDAMPSHTIVACGSQSSDPHQMGSGLILAHQPIIIDIFPRLLDCGYWGDMTRSYVKGTPNAALEKLYQTVLQGQDIGLHAVRSGASSRTIHQAIVQHFEQQGFPTGIKDGKQQGFFHGTGHGVGLDIHEQPRLSMCDDILQERQVVTVEPGLYYPGLGGVRLEDMVVVRNQGCDNLTQHPRQFVIA